MPQTVCSASGTSTRIPRKSWAKGLLYWVTDVCHAVSPLNAARLSQRWKKVQTPSGAIARIEARRDRRNVEWPASAPSWVAEDMDAATLRLRRRFRQRATGNPRPSGAGPGEEGAKNQAAGGGAGGCG